MIVCVGVVGQAVSPADLSVPIMLRLLIAKDCDALVSGIFLVLDLSRGTTLKLGVYSNISCKSPHILVVECNLQTGFQWTDSSHLLLNRLLLLRLLVFSRKFVREKEFLPRLDLS